MGNILEKQQDNNGFVAISGFGQYFSDKLGDEYRSITLDEIIEMVNNPPSVEKDKAQWLIPSTLETREHKAQYDNGEFHMLWADLDECQKSFEDTVEDLKKLDCDFMIYTTKSATADNQRCRILLPTDKPLLGCEQPLAQQAFNDWLQDNGHAPDRASERPAQLSYLPNRGKEIYKGVVQIDAQHLNVDANFGAAIEQKKKTSEGRKREQAERRKEAVRKRAERAQMGYESPIDAFNECTDLATLMISYGYDQNPRDDSKFRHPHSESGNFSASIKDNRLHTLSTSDPLYTDGEGAHDAFSIFTTLSHGGDEAAALEAISETFEFSGSEINVSALLDEFYSTVADVADVADVAVSHGGEDEKKWEEPEPLLPKLSYGSSLYPVDVFPILARDTLIEYQAYGQQPMALLGGSVLASLSVIAQGHIDVARDEYTVGPVSLFVLTVADSGERKTAADTKLSAPLRKYEKTLQAKAKKERTEAEAKIKTYELELSIAKQKVKDAHKSGTPSEIDKAKEQYETLLLKKPIIPFEPDIFYEDVTQEGLIASIETGYPSFAWWSDEGAMSLGGYSMDAERIARFFSTYDKLWGGGTVSAKRKLSSNTSVSGRRSTVNIAMQGHVMRSLIAKGDGAARGVGFFGRTLLSWPHTTMGTRMYRPPSSACEQAYQKYSGQLEALLEIPLPMDEKNNNALMPLTIQLSIGAHRVWVEYFNCVEKELNPEGQYIELSDFGSKSADNAARIAGCFHFFENGASGEISEDCMERAIVLARWYLDEALRVFGSMAVPEPIQNAHKLLQWLLEKGKKTISLRDISKNGPSKLRQKAKRDKALKILIDHGIIRKLDAPPNHIEINPLVKS